MISKNFEFTGLVNDGNFPQDIRVPLDDFFEDSRGRITNLVLHPMTSAACITSKQGTVRANHWHKTDWHYSYVVSGEILYFERPVGEISMPEPTLFRAGEMFFTPPNREHSMVFPIDTTFVTFARNVRSHESHEEDVVRMPFISQEEAQRQIARLGLP